MCYIYLSSCVVRGEERYFGLFGRYSVSYRVVVRKQPQQTASGYMIRGHLAMEHGIGKQHERFCKSV